MVGLGYSPPVYPLLFTPKFCNFQVRSLRYLSKVRGGVHADVLQYFKCAQTKQIRQNRQARRVVSMGKMLLNATHIKSELIFYS
ncbi:MAG: hypothetical protein ACI8PB_004755 [Desulforhopalus sp.]|jgi:hypothetical protein